MRIAIKQHILRNFTLMEAEQIAFKYMNIEAFETSSSWIDLTPLGGQAGLIRKLTITQKKSPSSLNQLIIDCCKMSIIPLLFSDWINRILLE